MGSRPAESLGKDEARKEARSRRIERQHFTAGGGRHLAREAGQGTMSGNKTGEGYNKGLKETPTWPFGGTSLRVQIIVQDGCLARSEVCTQANGRLAFDDEGGFQGGGRYVA